MAKLTVEERDDLVARLKDAYTRVKEEIAAGNQEMEDTIGNIRDGALADYNGLVAESRSKMKAHAEALQEEYDEKEAAFEPSDEDDEFEETDEASNLSTAIDLAENYMPEDIEIADAVTLEVPDEPEVASDLEELDL